MEVHAWGDPPSSHYSPTEVLLSLLIRAELETFPLLRLIPPIASYLPTAPSIRLTYLDAHKIQGRAPTPTSPPATTSPAAILLAFGFSSDPESRVCSCEGYRGRFGPLLRSRENMAGPRSPRWTLTLSGPWPNAFSSAPIPSSPCGYGALGRKVFESSH